MAISPSSLSQGTGLDHFTSWLSIPIHGGQTSNELRLHSLNPTQQWSCWRLGMANSNLGVPGGRPALTCLGIQSP